MDKYQIGINKEIEYEPGSEGRVLKNFLGITDVEEMNRTESEALQNAIENSYELFEVGMEFSTKLIIAMHSDWLGGIYPFAGTIRTVDLSKSGILFCPHLNIPTELRRFDAEILEPLGGWAPPPASSTTEQLNAAKKLVVLKIAQVHCELILIHPFREGNGRLARWVSDVMALLSGFPAPTYELNSASEISNYHYALQFGFKGNLGPLTDLFYEWISHAEREQTEESQGR